MLGIPTRLKALEPAGCQRGVLDIGVPHVRLDRPGVVVIVGKLKSGGMPQHVGVHLDAEIGFDESQMRSIASVRPSPRNVQINRRICSLAS
jgi:hypothetical protein